MTSGPIWDVVSPLIDGLKSTSDNEAKASCPFHHDSTPSFFINLSNGLWICHAGCGAGDLRTLLTMLGMSKSLVHKTIDPIQEDIRSNIKRRELKDRIRFRKDPFIGDHILPEEILGAFDYCPMYLTSRGFDKNLLRSLDVGYDQKLNRVTFPIRDFYGNLVGVSGRSDDGESLRYKFYKGGYWFEGEKVAGDFGENFDEEFPKYDLDKRKYLWNSHRAVQVLLNTNTNQPLIIVEGYKACLWLLQCGFPTTVALMGSSMSKEQGDIIRRVSNPLILFLDNNMAGIKGTKKIADELIKTNLDTKVVLYPEWADIRTQPDDINTKGLNRAVNGAKRWTWLRMNGF